MGLIGVRIKVRVWVRVVVRVRVGVRVRVRVRVRGVQMVLSVDEGRQFRFSIERHLFG